MVYKMHIVHFFFFFFPHGLFCYLDMLNKRIEAVTKVPLSTFNNMAVRTSCITVMLSFTLCNGGRYIVIS